ncbi:MAG: 1-(5-phosphoribosyl)-5-[(5-phosphoribosylamino)methylideneamino]imidazole-4-carboxamide isomerase [Maricaulaceae bacterium]
MILYPAIDLKNGEAVRLVRGDMAQATVFNAAPVEQARQFATLGFSWLHIVDLDGAFAGESRNGAVVRAILEAVDVSVQLGGGIRTLDGVEAWLSAGVQRVILGTAAVRDPDLVRVASRRFPGRVAVGIDVKGGRVAVEGWAEQSAVSALELAKRFEDAGVAALIVTDVDRDGVKAGINLELTGALADAVRIPVIASGGLAGLEDLHAIKARSGVPISGAVLGRALYDGGVDPRAALTLAGSD